MKLERLILVNWGSLRSQEYPMGNMTLLTGPTGSGKSTLLDALQTIMTAAYQNIFNYNPGQDETTQSSRSGKSKRTLWSYIVGAEDNLFARPDGAHGYIAAVFKPSEGEMGKEFTALIAASARVDGSGERKQAVQERLALLIVDEAGLRFEDLTTIDEDGHLQVVPVEKVDGHLKGKFRQVANYRDAKREYLCQLYGRFRGQRTVSFAEAELAARAWSQSIAHKPIGSVDELVKTQILEHDPQDLSQRISQIGGLMRQVSNLRSDGERLKANIGRLELIGEKAGQAATAYETNIQYQLLGSKRILREDERLLVAADEAMKSLNAKIEQETYASDARMKDKEALTQSQIRIQARLSGIPAAEQKKNIQERLGRAKQQVKSAIASLLSNINAAEALQTTARQIIGIEFPAEHRVLKNSAARVAAALSSCANVHYATSADRLKQIEASDDLDIRAALSLSREFDDAETHFANLFATLVGFENSFVSVLHAQAALVNNTMSEAAKKERDAATRKTNLVEGGADYPRPTLNALKQLRSELSGAHVQVLCDLIEPASVEWQTAIEGYMGGARFNFLVDQDWEARAITFLREQNLRATIIQGSLCLKHAKAALVPSDSIIHELLTEHPTAKAYLIEQFGSVVKVPDAQALRHTPRGLTKDGKGSGSRTMFTTDVQALAFGKEAKRLARERADIEHAEAEALLLKLREQLKNFSALIALVGRVARPTFTAVADLESNARDIESARADIARLDLTEVDKLEAEASALMVQIRSIEDQIRQSDQSIGGYRDNIERYQADALKLESAHDGKLAKVETDASKLRDLCVINGALSFTQLCDEIDGLVEENTLSAHDIQTRIANELSSAQAYFGDVREGLADYNSHAQTDERFEIHVGTESPAHDFAPIYKQLVHLQEKVREQLSIQREIGLVKNLDQLRTAESSFKDVFTKQFCYEIRNAVDIGIKTLRSLNAELERLKFGTDKFRIDWSEWVPEFKEYYGFFSAAYDLSETAESGDLFGTTELSPDNCKVRDKLVSLLLSNDQDHAQKELQRVADYRNYRRYEIWKESDIGSRVPLSEWGTGSGGQLETPAYIVRAAVVTNRLKHFDKGINLKLMANDESFSKMDERRAHDVIKFMRDHLGMQLICAMPTKHAGAIKTGFTKEWCFTRTEAEGNGEVDFISEADERDLHPDRLRELWDARREQVRIQAQMRFEEKEQA
ncbi:MAG: ATP-binding protein [Pseudomonadota bacterium]